ncbi:hypothetical protein LTR36_003174 [Oleoguttula mirabilis]|uniref:DUF726-domain-containing protein n=1 Tax=Oleoguttula mirabilis TaxID=1507867 RepID=A0AAV9JWT2_9PEZI|nr:hypothetical protein LTR36_003174 [Oleoguttula mirabilis]
MAADAGAKHEGGSEQVEVETRSDAATVPDIQPAVLRAKHDAPTPDAPEADEFGLPVKPPRRRTYSLDDLESPEAVKAPVVKGGDGDGVIPEEAREDVHTTQDGKRDVIAKTVESEPVTAAAKAAAEDGQPQRPRVDTGTAAIGDGQPSSSRTPHLPSAGATSEWSHQQLAPHADAEEEKDEEQKWQAMPALAEHRIYDDWGKVLAKSYDEVDDEQVAYGTLGGAGKGYTRVQIDDDAQSATSMDDNTAYLFKDQQASNTLAEEEDEEERDIASQMQTTKELLTEAQRIAYVGVVRLAVNKMAADLETLEKVKGAKKSVELAAEATKMWGQKMMVRLYKHMDIDSQEQVMVEQLADHGVRPEDLTPTLMANARVKNPQRAESETSSITSARPSLGSPRPSDTLEKRASTPGLSVPGTPGPSDASASAPPPAYEEHAASDLTIKDASELNTKNIDLDLRWTVLCDLFLLLIADSTYDARSRTLLERVSSALSVDWQELCRFEKRVTDALEVQEQADKENWNEDDHMKAREKRARNKRLMVMGLCTVGGGLVIGLSAGMLAPVIGAGLAAGFTGIGVAGTGGFLGGTGAAALIGTTGTFIGGMTGLKGANRRTGAVKTFEYRPLFNNKRVNLIVTVSGWMTGKVDDVRLPFSTVDPIMGDIYSINWEPEMLQSTGQTIQILGTEALTQTIQQILGATFLATLMAGLSLPIVLTKLAYLIDNPWTVSLARADATGLILADSLIDRNLGVRPITLVGFSLGSRVIFACLRELARRGAIGLVQNVYMFGSPVVVKRDEWTRARTIVSGRFVNGYATNDWILAYLFRATSGGVGRVAGLNTVELAGIENINVTEVVPGHMAYRAKMPVLLHQVGWVVESEEFSEIEDPDPENHEKRQRELIREIEEARREAAEEKPEKKGFLARFSRKKAVSKKAGWETYDERNAKVLAGDADASLEVAEDDGNSHVMFDVDAIRREALALAEAGGDLDEIKAHLNIREIETTMPALRISSSPQQQQPEGSGSKANGVLGSGGGASSSTLGLQRAQTHDGLGAAANGANGAIGSHYTTPTAGSVVHHGVYDHDDDPFDDSNVSLSFETPTRPAALAAATTPYTNGSSSSSYHQPEAAHWDNGPPRSSNSGAIERPALRSVNTTPAPKAASHQLPATEGSPDHNPWAHEEDFGKEKEMEMSFE